MNTNRRPIRAWIPILLFVAVVAGSGPLARAEGETLDPVVFANGGGVVTNGTNSVTFSVGQPLVGFVSGGVAEVEMGFWPLLLTPHGPVTSVLVPIPLRTELRQNAPNPFNPTTTISFVVGREGHVRMRLFDLQGREVDRLVDSFLPVGEHTLVFRPRNLASGVYLYQLETPDQTTARRLVLLK